MSPLPRQPSRGFIAARRTWRMARTTTSPFPGSQAGASLQRDSHPPARACFPTPLPRQPSRGFIAARAGRRLRRPRRRALPRQPSRGFIAGTPGNSMESSSASPSPAAKPGLHCRILPELLAGRHGGGLPRQPSRGFIAGGPRRSRHSGRARTLPRQPSRGFIARTARRCARSRARDPSPAAKPGLHCRIQTACPAHSRPHPFPGSQAGASLQENIDDYARPDEGTPFPGSQAGAPWGCLREGAKSYVGSTKFRCARLTGERKG